MAATSKQLPILADSAPNQCLARVYVWELPVRISHWLIFFSIVVLSFTGWYMHSPFLSSRGPTSFTMATMRFTHLVAGYVFLASFILRVYWFFAGNYWASWTFFVPSDKQRWKSMRQMLKYYSFLRREPVRDVGHNALAGITYSIIFLIMAWEIFSGLVLYSQVRGPGLARSLFGWAPRVVDIQYIRLFHFLGMFAVIAFAIHHVYSAVLVSIEERNALIESMFSGYKFVLDYELKEQELRQRILLRESLAGRIGRWLANRKKKKVA
jgi:Ni/Fe-hydrogenase 1 B-type cytochrome subunit